MKIYIILVVLLFIENCLSVNNSVQNCDISGSNTGLISEVANILEQLLLGQKMDKRKSMQIDVAAVGKLLRNIYPVVSNETYRLVGQLLLEMKRTSEQIKNTLDGEKKDDLLVLMKSKLILLDKYNKRCFPKENIDPLFIDSENS